MIIAVVMIRRRRSVFFATQREPTNRAAAAEAEARSWHASAPSSAVFAPEVAQDQNIHCIGENHIRYKQSKRMNLKGPFEVETSLWHSSGRVKSRRFGSHAPYSASSSSSSPSRDSSLSLYLPTFPMEVICIRYGSSSAGSQSFHLAVVTRFHRDFHSGVAKGLLWNNCPNLTLQNVPHTILLDRREGFL